MSNTPIAYIVFNRPDLTRTSFETIKNYRPSHLFIIADGPRLGHPTDEVRCDEVRRIIEQIDWPCEVYRNYSNRNLGCKDRIISGLNWVFENVEYAVILEDDVIPHPDFFGYCDELLSRYKNDERVACITGDNFQNGICRGDDSYYFSKYNHVWGWATWRRVWEKNNSSLTFWPEWKKSSDWRKVMPDNFERRYWEKVMNKVHNNEIDTWDYQWMCSLWFNGGLIATPNVNLVTNIGIGPDATHTIDANVRKGVQTHSLGQLTHPRSIEQNILADKYTFYQHFGGNSFKLSSRLLKLLKLVVKKITRTFHKLLEH